MGLVTSTMVLMRTMGSSHTSNFDCPQHILVAVSFYTGPRGNVWILLSI